MQRRLIIDTFIDRLTVSVILLGWIFMKELIFEVNEDKVDGGFTASALGLGIHTQGDTIEELRQNVREAIGCYFDENMELPKIIRLHFVRDEVLTL